MFITNGGVSEVYMLNCRTRPDRSNIDGCNWLMFTKDTPGYSIGKYEHKVGWRTSTNATVYIDDMWIPEEDMVGAEGEGYWVIENILLENAVAGDPRYGVAVCGRGGAFHSGHHRAQ